MKLFQYAVILPKMRAIEEWIESEFKAAYCAGYVDSTRKESPEASEET